MVRREVAAVAGLLAVCVVIPLAAGAAGHRARSAGARQWVRGLAVAVLLAVAVVWLVWEPGAEGRVLLAFGRHHGVTVSDLLAAWPVVAAWVADGLVPR